MLGDESEVVVSVYCWIVMPHDCIGVGKGFAVLLSVVVVLVWGRGVTGVVDGDIYSIWWSCCDRWCMQFVFVLDHT